MMHKTVHADVIYVICRTFIAVLFFMYNANHSEWRYHISTLENYDISSVFLYDVQSKCVGVTMPFVREWIERKPPDM